VERSFCRRVRIPDGVLRDTIKSSVDEYGHLHIEGKKVAEEQPPKRSISIEYQPTVVYRWA